MHSLLLLFLSIACQPATTNDVTVQEANANVIAIETSGSEGSFTFTVTIKSPDLDCQQYADWWEVIDTGGNLVYRRILRHSHANEQPFTRSGGPVNITNQQVVWIRAHMNNTGYGGTTMKGSVNTGFEASGMPEGFAAELDGVAPLPTGCDF